MIQYLLEYPLTNKFDIIDLFVKNMKIYQNKKWIYLFNFGISEKNFVFAFIKTKLWE
jgi:hypothetical protein